jgi:hypothetical protein
LNRRAVSCSGESDSSRDPTVQRARETTRAGGRT